MTEFHFIRHAESKMNTQPELIVGRSNHTPLTAKGLYQAALLGAHFREQATTYDAIYSSGAVRADQTAQYILEAAGWDTPIHYDPRLQEVSQGLCEGKHRQRVYLPAIVDRFHLDDLDGQLPGGESLQGAQDRMWEFVQFTHETRPDSRLLVVSHGLAIRALVGKICEQSKQAVLDASTPNVSLTSITVVDGEPTVHHVGKTTINE